MQPTPPPEVKPRAREAEPLPELDPDRCAIQVELTASSEIEKLTDSSAEQETKPSSKPFAQLLRETEAQWHATRQAKEVKDALLLVLYLMWFMAAANVIVLLGRLNTAALWASLMEAAGFVDWPQIDGLQALIIYSELYVVAGVVATLVGLCFRRCIYRYYVLLGLSYVLLLTAVASACAFIWLFLTADERHISDDTVRELAKQPDAGANFNRGYCEAWCRQTDAGLAAFLRGDCGPDKTTAFDRVISYFKVGDWCMQAIAKQNFELVAAYDGVSPFAGLKGDGGKALVRAIMSDMLTLFSGIMGLSLFPLRNQVEKNRPRT